MTESLLVLKTLFFLSADVEALCSSQCVCGEVEEGKLSQLKKFSLITVGGCSLEVCMTLLDTGHPACSPRDEESQ